MKIGVSGASGHLGKAIVGYLKDRVDAGDIVAISRTPEVADGVEGRFGDYDDPASLASAYAGLDRLILIPTTDLRPGARAAQTVGAVAAAAKAGVGHIVYVSSLGASDAPEPDVRASYFATEQALMRSGAKWSILRMAYYIESFVHEAQQMLPMGMLTGLGEAPVNFVSRDDLAAAAAGLLTGEGHDGAIYNGTGPATFTGTARAAAVSAAAGQPIAFVTLTHEQLAGGMAQMGLPEAVVNTVASIQQGFARGGFDIVTGDIERLSGRAPQTLEAALADAFKR
jgi:NAD(P)H dehydrogenase (quinone)